MKKIATREYEQKTVEHQFDSFCKKILKGELINYKREIQRKQKSETSIHEISDFKTVDFRELDYNVISCYGEKFILKNDLLYYSLKKLHKEKLDIILLFYFLEMTDQEIGQALKIIRRTVNYKRNRALKELRKFMED